MRKKLTYNEELFVKKFGAVGLEFLLYIRKREYEIISLRYGLEDHPILTVNQISERFNCTDDQVKRILCRVERRFKFWLKKHNEKLIFYSLSWKLLVLNSELLLKHYPLFLNWQVEYIRCYESSLKDTPLPDKIKLALEKANYRTIGDLLERRHWRLGNVRFIGRKQVKQIIETLMDF